MKIKTILIALMLGSCSSIDDPVHQSQRALNDCGPATAVMLLRENGKKATLAEVNAATPLRGVWGYWNFSDLIEALATEQIKARKSPVKVTEQAGAYLVRSIFFNHWVMAKLNANGQVVVYDPMGKITRQSKESFLGRVQGDKYVEIVR